MLPVLPEINALQSGMRERSGGLHRRGREARATREDVCTYVKCDIGMLQQRQHRPHRAPSCPSPTCCCCRYTGCFTFMKWFELLREALPVPGGDAARALPAGRRDHAGDARATSSTSSAQRGDPGAGARPPAAPSTSDRAERAASALLRAGRGRPGGGVGVRASTGPRPSTPTSAASTTSGRSSPPSAAPRTRWPTTASCARRSRRGRRAAKGPLTPDGPLRRRALPPGVEGPPNWTSFLRLLAHVQRARARWWWPAPTRAWAASTTRASATTRRGRWRASPNTAWAATPTSGCPPASALLERYIRDYAADGFVDQQRQVLQLVQRRTAPDAARAGEAHRRARGASSSPTSWTRATSARPTSRTACRATCRCSRRAAGACRHEVRGRHRPGLHDDQGGAARRAAGGRRPRDHQQPQQLRGGLRGGPRGGADRGALEPAVRAGRCAARRRRVARRAVRLAALPTREAFASSSTATSWPSCGEEVLRCWPDAGGAASAEASSSPRRREVLDEMERRRPRCSWRRAAPERLLPRRGRRRLRGRRGAGLRARASALRAPDRACSTGRSSTSRRGSPPATSQPLLRRRAGPGGRADSRSRARRAGARPPREPPGSDRGGLRGHRLRPADPALPQGGDAQRDPLPRPRRPPGLPGHAHRARHRRPGHQGDPGRRPRRGHLLPDERPLRRRVRPLPRLHRRRAQPRAARAGPLALQAAQPCA